MSTALGLVAIVVLIAVTGVFVAAEFGLVAADRSRIATMAEGGSRRARLVRSLLATLSFQLSGAQLGITVTSLLLGFLAEPVLAQLIEPMLRPVLGEGLVRGVSIAIALALATVLQMVLGELIPKTVAIAKPETTVLWLAPFLQLYATVFGPLIRLLNRAANWTVRRLGIEPREELESVRSLPELARLLEASVEEGTIGDTASTLFTRSVRFADKTAADALVPRVAVSALAVDDHVADLVELAGRTGFSRFPVYGADLDDIVGVVLVKSVHSLPRDVRATTPVARPDGRGHGRPRDALAAGAAGRHARQPQPPRRGGRRVRRHRRDHHPRGRRRGDRGRDRRRVRPARAPPHRAARRRRAVAGARDPAPRRGR